MKSGNALRLLAIAVGLATARCATTSANRTVDGPATAPDAAWGVLGFRDSTATVFSTAHLPEGMRLTAVQIGDWNRTMDVSIGRGQPRTDSRVYDKADGDGPIWEHQLSTDVQVAGDALWVCLPPGTSAVGQGRDGATLRRARREIGSIRIDWRSEGVDVTVQMEGRSQVLYYWLGYEIGEERDQ